MLLSVVLLIAVSFVENLCCFLDDEAEVFIDLISAAAGVMCFVQ